MKPNKSKPDSKVDEAPSATAAPATVPFTPPPATHDPKNEMTLETRPGARTSERVEARLNPYIEAHQKDLGYYTKLIAENPERAARTLMLKDLEMHEETMKRVTRQLPQAREFYEKQTPEIKKRIDDAVAAVNPYHHDQAFVGEVVTEYNRQNYGKLFSKKPALGEATPAAAISMG